MTKPLEVVRPDRINGSNKPKRSRVSSGSIKVPKKGIRRSEKRKRGSRLHIFLDIDSTITHNDEKQPDPRCREVVKMLHGWGHRVYLVSGRAKGEVIAVRDAISAQPLAVGENGGIVIRGNRIVKVLGDKKGCKKGLQRLRRRIKVGAVAKMEYKTEIILKKGTGLAGIRKIIKDSGLDIDITSSRRYWHLHKNEVNKGSTLNFIIRSYGIPFEYTVAFGDSDIDHPMLKMAKYGYLVNNASPKLKKRYKQRFVLSNSYFEGVMEGITRHEPRLRHYVKKNKRLRN